MKYIFGFGLLLIFVSFKTNTNKESFANNVSVLANDSIPSYLFGTFVDDYGIEYSLTDTLFTQNPNIRYHIVTWNVKESYFIAQNDLENPSEKGLFTRVDYMKFEGMSPFIWGFCYTDYKAKSVEEAVNKASADRLNPKIGCGGYPFSRMKPYSKK